MASTDTRVTFRSSTMRATRNAPLAARRNASTSPLGSIQTPILGAMDGTQRDETRPDEGARAGHSADIGRVNPPVGGMEDVDASASPPPVSALGSPSTSQTTKFLWPVALPATPWASSLPNPYPRVNPCSRIVTGGRTRRQ